MTLRTTIRNSVLLLAACLLTSCGGEKDMTEIWTVERAAMVNTLRHYGVKDERILAAMQKVPRHQFIPAKHRRLDAYGDHPCPIGYNQTISQPFIVAHMTSKINPRSGEKVLEIGTGSGYQAAVLAALGSDVYSVEIIPELAAHAKHVLANEGFTNVLVRTSDGYKGWPEHAPFDVIIVTCAPENIPDALISQLREGGRMILPLGGYSQQLVMLRKEKGRIVQEEDIAVRFVPMVKETQ